MMERMQDIRLFCSLHVRRAKKGGISSAQELDLLSEGGALRGETHIPYALRRMGISKPVVSVWWIASAERNFWRRRRVQQTTAVIICVSQRKGGRSWITHISIIWNRCIP